MRALRVTRTMQPQRMLVGSGAALRGYAEKAGANPWANAPKDEAALREAILKSNPDLRSSGPAATLARTLFVSSALASSGASAHEAVAKDLAKVKEALQFAEWQQFFVSPIITPAERHATLKELFDKIGASEITRQFFARLVESKATKYVASMIDVHAQIVRSQKNEVSATIVTARPMTASETTKLRAAIAAHFVDSGPSTKVLLEQRVDPSILGGLQLTVGSTYVDFSLKAQVDEIEAEFAAHNSAKFESLLLRQV